LSGRRILQQSCWDYGSQLCTANELGVKHLAVIMQIIGIGSPECDALTEKLVVEFRSRNCQRKVWSARWHTTGEIEAIKGAAAAA